ncbi:hypothetical protein L7F22_035441 [Adiantum nelumboides]|nr:hypothetical protein [Adiantum nelumboides]
MAMLTCLLRAGLETEVMRDLHAGLTVYSMHAWIGGVRTFQKQGGKETFLLLLHAVCQIWKHAEVNRVWLKETSPIGSKFARKPCWVGELCRRLDAIVASPVFLKTQERLTLLPPTGRKMVARCGMDGWCLLEDENKEFEVDWLRVLTGGMDGRCLLKDENKEFEVDWLHVLAGDEENKIEDEGDMSQETQQVLPTIDEETPFHKGDAMSTQEVVEHESDFVAQKPSNDMNKGSENMLPTIGETQIHEGNTRNSEEKMVVVENESDVQTSPKPSDDMIIKDTYSMPLRDEEVEGSEKKDEANEEHQGALATTEVQDKVDKGTGEATRNANKAQSIQGRVQGTEGDEENKIEDEGDMSQETQQVLPTIDEETPFHKGDAMSTQEVVEHESDFVAQKPSNDMNKGSENMLPTIGETQIHEGNTRNSEEKMVVVENQSDVQTSPKPSDDMIIKDTYSMPLRDEEVEGSEKKDEANEEHQGALATTEVQDKVDKGTGEATRNANKAQSIQGRVQGTEGVGFDFAHGDANDDTPMLVNYLATRLQQAMGNTTLQSKVQQQLRAYAILPLSQQERDPEKSHGETSKRGLSMEKGVENPYQELKQLLEGKPSSKMKGHAPHEGLPPKERERRESQDESMENVAPRIRRAQRSPTPPKQNRSPHSPHRRKSKREEKSSRKRKERKRSPSSPSSSPSCSSEESSGYLSQEKKRRGQQRSYAAWKKSTKLKKFKEGGKNISFLNYDDIFDATDKVLAFIQHFNAPFGDEGFTESSKLHHIAMYFQKFTKQWWASTWANGEAPKTWKA